MTFCPPVLEFNKPGHATVVPAGLIVTERDCHTRPLSSGDSAQLLHRHADVNCNMCRSKQTHESAAGSRQTADGGKNGYFTLR